MKNSKVTSLLMAATHVYRSEIESDIDERMKHPYKSSIDDSSIDLKKIKDELESSKSHFLIRNFIYSFILVVAIVMLLTSHGNQYEDILGSTIFALFIVEFFSTLLNKKRIREIINQRWKEDEVTDSDSSFKQPKVVVSGGFSPFIGAGIDLDSWSFPINIDLPADENKPVEEITPTDMHKWIVNHLKELGIDEMEIEEQLFVNGKDVNHIPELMPNGRLDKPETDLNASFLEDKMFGNDKLMRHYTAVRIPIYENQVVVSMFFRLLKAKDTLFIESRFFLLRPLSKKYRDLDSTPSKYHFRDLAGDAILALIKAPFKSVFGLLQLLSIFSTDRQQFKNWREEVEDNRLYNYGWDFSLREKWASKTFERYFQQIDQDLYLKLLTDEFLNSILSYLKQKNVSTERFVQTSTKIINEGVMISGGEVKTDSFAVGKGANIVKTATSKIQGEQAA